MFKILLLAAIVFCTGFTSVAVAQDASQRTQELVAALDKTKYKKKEKKNISIEIYIDIKNQAVVKTNPAEYSGVYEAEESSYRLELQIAANGSATGNGDDTVDNGDGKSHFTLKDAWVEGALLTATKIFDNGRTEKFEALFTNRTVSTGKNADTIESHDTTFGIGFIQSHGTWQNRVFLERR